MLAQQEVGPDQNAGTPSAVQWVTTGIVAHPHPKHPTSTGQCKPCLASQAQPLDPLVAIVVFLLTPQGGAPELGASSPFTSLPGFSHWQHLCPSQLVQHIKTCKSCHNWTVALIQKHFDMGWDLLTHCNVESISQLGLACPIPMIVIALATLYSGSVCSLAYHWPMYPPPPDNLTNWKLDMPP